MSLTEVVMRRFPKAYRQAVPFAVLIGLLLLSGSTHGQPHEGHSSEEDWPSFLGPSGNSRSIETDIRTDWKKNPPDVIWQTEVGEGYGTCAISHGRCFLFDRIDDLARLRCLQADTGKSIWEYTYPTNYEDAFGYNKGPRCSPVTDGEIVFVYGVEGELHGVNVADGQRVWRVNTMAEFGVVPCFFGVGSTPQLHGDLLLVMVGGSPAEFADTPIGQLDRVVGDGSGIVAFDKRTGKIRYSITDELASYSSIRTARIGDRDWGFALARGGLVGFNPNLGTVDFELPWRAKNLESVNASSPVIVEDEVFITETYGPGACLLKVKPKGYELIWRDSENGRARALPAHWNTPVVHDGFLYGSSGRYARPAELRCVEWKTGKVTWSKKGLARSSLLYVDDHLLCLSEDGTVVLLKANPEKYEEVARLDWGEEGQALLTSPAWSAPVLSHGLLYLRGRNRLVCALLKTDP